MLSFSTLVGLFAAWLLCVVRKRTSATTWAWGSRSHSQHGAHVRHPVSERYRAGWLSRKGIFSEDGRRPLDSFLKRAVLNSKLGMVLEMLGTLLAM